jgi:hypothetical protein
MTARVSPNKSPSCSSLIGRWQNTIHSYAPSELALNCDRPPLNPPPLSFRLRLPNVPSGVNRFICVLPLPGKSSGGAYLEHSLHGYDFEAKRLVTLNGAFRGPSEFQREININAETGIMDVAGRFIWHPTLDRPALPAEIGINTV